MNSGHEQPQATRNWYIKVDGQAYGPFDDRTLWSYMLEGRVSAQSLISQSANSGYIPVSSNSGLMSWLSQATEAQKPQAQVQAQTQAQPQQHAVKPEFPPTVFMIMAEIRSGRGMNFLQALQGLGPTQRLGETVWILQAQTKADLLRDILTQALGPDDRLFLLDSFANETSWLNLSAEMDGQIERFWNIKR